jgi:hypothetical protein
LDSAAAVAGPADDLCGAEYEDAPSLGSGGKRKSRRGSTDSQKRIKTESDEEDDDVVFVGRRVRNLAGEYIWIER